MFAFGGEGDLWRRIGRRRLCLRWSMLCNCVYHNFVNVVDLLQTPGGGPDGLLVRAVGSDGEASCRVGVWAGEVGWVSLVWRRCIRRA